MLWHKHGVLQKYLELLLEVKNIKIVAKEFNISYERLAKIAILKRTKLKKSNYDTTKENRYKKKKLLVEYKGGKCEICGYDKCLAALEFHHIDPDKKDFSISSSSKSIDELKLEADKCILVCANCHREIHNNLIKLSKIDKKGLRKIKKSRKKIKK